MVFAKSSKEMLNHMVRVGILVYLIILKKAVHVSPFYIYYFFLDIGGSVYYTYQSMF